MFWATMKVLTIKRFSRNADQTGLLNFVLSRANRNGIDVNYIYLSLEATIYDADGKKASDGVEDFFANNAQHSLFLQVQLFFEWLPDSRQQQHVSPLSIHRADEK